MELLKYRNKFLLALAVLFGLSVTFIGGAKLLIYFLLSITGFYLGLKYASFKRLYEDYKLSLRVNSVLVSSKQTEQLQTENDRLKQELVALSQRMQVYQSNIPRRNIAINDVEEARFR